jgi:hypothetical protein
VELADAGFLERVDVQKAMRVRRLGRDEAAVDARFEEEWMRIPRFAHGVVRVEIHSLAGKTVRLPVSFRSGLIRDIQLPKTTLAELHVRDGDDVNVRPIA